MEPLKSQASLCLHDAAQLLVSGLISAHDAEVILANAIEHGELHANIKRWSSEQWEGERLPGNLCRRETFIERSALEAWQKDKV
ncbi:MAG: hypothetical protein WAV95_05365 [Azonexus sp.]